MYQQLICEADKKDSHRNRVKVMVFSANFNNISAISWRSVLLVEKTWVPGEKHWPVASRRQILSHNVASSTLRLSRIRTHNFSGDRRRLHGWLLIQLPYDYHHDCLCHRKHYLIVFSNIDNQDYWFSWYSFDWFVVYVCIVSTGYYADQKFWRC